MAMAHSQCVGVTLMSSYSASLLPKIGSAALPPLLHLPSKNHLVLGVKPKPSRTLSSSSSSIRCCFSKVLTPELKTTLDAVVTANKVLLFMKGTKEFPQCGFSKTVVQILNSLNVPFETINILENELLRQAMKEYSNWPTFPQLYIEGEFFGGCDITIGKKSSFEYCYLLEYVRIEIRMQGLIANCWTSFLEEKITINLRHTRVDNFKNCWRRHCAPKTLSTWLMTAASL
ncbi:Glutaredoxin domain-containing protein [Cephalotus follicularis]|uniref:Glutaredoxin domain-containing protein n=1 Tax=Cephalotus follicularis TaxID=3775 RepID=A0A1Q3CP57_CEPFO|nr:Glutaredoxin domain-containing protein [Cephalotus follicularis]